MRNLKLIFGCLVILWSPFAYAADGSGESQPTKQDSKAKDTPPSITNPQPDGSPSVRDNIPLNHSYNSGETDNQSHEKSSGDAWIVRFTACLVLVGVFQCFLYHLQWKVMTRQAGIMEQQIRHSRLEQRAWIGVVGTKHTGLQANKPFMVSVVVSNGGKTFATKVNIPIHYRCISRVQGDITIEEEKAVVAPGISVPGVQTTSAAVGVALSQSDFDKIKRGEDIVYIYGKITYEDIFGVHHWTKYCFFYDPSANVFSCHHKHNEIDNNLA